jgi:hypothetical protein
LCCGKQAQIRKRGHHTAGKAVAALACPGATSDYRSVSLSSMRRFLARASSLSAVSSGWNSPKPAATSRLAGTPF